MRLTCPNCDAQYEVPDDVIPTAGRDVQCSNCGKTWFQLHPEDPPKDSAVQPDEAPATVEEDDDDAPSAAEPALASPRRDLDPGVAEILREEAEAERAARERQRQETAPPVTRPDRGRDQNKLEDDFLAGLETEDEDDEIDWEQHRQTLEARRKLADLRSDAAPDPAQDAATPGKPARHGELPDVEKISSSLRADRDRGSKPAAVDAETLPAPRRRTGFGAGFLLVLGIAATMLLLYAFAPQIARSVPQADSALTSYVAWIDGGRDWFNAVISGLLAPASSS